MKKIKVKLFGSESWSTDAVRLLSKDILAAKNERGKCNLILTGGRSAKILYENWSSMKELSCLKNANIFFSDERCIPKDHPESNYGMLVKSLFPSGIIDGCNVVPMEFEDNQSSMRSYEKKLPESFDIALFSIGNDGHFASIFPGGDALCCAKNAIAKTLSPNFPHQRMTITPLLLGRIKKIYIMAIGESKINILRRALEQPSLVGELPARMLLRHNWLIASSNDDNGALSG